MSRAAVAATAKRNQHVSAVNGEPTKKPPAVLTDSTRFEILARGGRASVGLTKELSVTPATKSGSQTSSVD